MTQGLLKHTTKSAKTKIETELASAIVVVLGQQELFERIVAVSLGIPVSMLIAIAIAIAATVTIAVGEAVAIAVVPTTVLPDSS
jgi:hypothetical protein